ncbi:MAG: IS1634 family transposase [Actinobacteria bacterium]|nr:IS1634 family transposase [Actinomycetota bacterium]
MPPGDPFELESQRLGALPIIDRFLGRMGLAARLERCLPGGDARVSLSTATVIGVLVANLGLEREPLYGLAGWAGSFEPGLMGLQPGEAALLNDDRVGRALDALFDADRATLLTELTLHVISEFAVDCAQLHNDSTSIALHGDYTAADGRARAGKPTPAAALGHSKDHRPDLKQLVLILTVSADGAVPLAHRLTDGNTSDDSTHIATWDGLVALTGRPDFLYVADSKLCTRGQMGHIDGRGGRFVTVLPRTRREDGQLRDWMADEAPAFTEAIRKPARRKGDPDNVWSVCPAPLPSAEGHRIVWVHSTAKQRLDETARSERIQRARRDLTELGRRLAGPRARIGSLVAAEEAAAGAADRDRRAALGHRHRDRGDHRDDAPGEARAPRQGHPLPQDDQDPLRPDGHDQRRQGPPRRRLRRLLPADQQRPQPHRPGDPHRLPLPAEPREAPPPTEVRPGRRARHAPQPGPHRGALRVPLHRPALLLPDRARAPRRDDPPRHR